MNMKLKVLAFVAVMAMSVSGPADAGYYMSAYKLLGLCESDSVANQNVCVGYVLGIVDAAQALDSEANLRRYCLPENVSSSRLERTAVKYMNDNSQQLDKSASYYVLVSLRKAFPCE